MKLFVLDFVFRAEILLNVSIGTVSNDSAFYRNTQPIVTIAKHNNLRAPLHITESRLIFSSIYGSFK